MLNTALYQGKEYGVVGVKVYQNVTMRSKVQVDSTWKYNNSTGNYEKTVDLSNITAYSIDYYGVYDSQEVFIEEFDCDTRKCYACADSTSSYSSGFVSAILQNERGCDIRVWTSMGRFEYFIEKKYIYGTNNLVSENEYNTNGIINRYKPLV